MHFYTGTRRDTLADVYETIKVYTRQTSAKQLRHKMSSPGGAPSSFGPALRRWLVDERGRRRINLRSARQPHGSLASRSVPHIVSRACAHWAGAPAERGPLFLLPCPDTPPSLHPIRIRRFSFRITIFLSRGWVAGWPRCPRFHRQRHLPAQDFPGAGPRKTRVFGSRASGGPDASLGSAPSTCCRRRCRGVCRPRAGLGGVSCARRVA